MEIASNDGYLLQHFVARAYPVLGIEPAANVARSGGGEGYSDAGAVLWHADRARDRAEPARGPAPGQQRARACAGPQ